MPEHNWYLDSRAKYANVITATTAEGTFTIKDRWGRPQRSVGWLDMNPDAELKFYDDAERTQETKKR